MIYLLIAMGIALGTVFLPALIGALISREETGRTIILGAIGALVYGLIAHWAIWGIAAGLYGPAPLGFAIFFGCIIGAIIGGWSEGYFRSALPGLAMALIWSFYVIIIVLFFGQSHCFHANQKAKLIGDVQTITDLSSVMQPADEAHVCLVDEEMAKVAAQNALSKFKVKGGAIPGSRYTIGSPTKQFVDGQLWWIFPLEFKWWLKWRQDPQVPGYFRVSAENPFAEGQAVQTNKSGEEIHIKYLNSGSFEGKAIRYLRYHGYMGKILMDWTFEPDDNWNPFYTVSVVERTIGFTGYKTLAVLAFDLQTGEMNLIPLDEMGKHPWIDRVHPLKIIDYNHRMWGKYAKEGWWYVFKHNDKSQKPTEGWFLTYGAEGGCQWFSGYTSMSVDDKAMTGFSVTNARDMTTAFFAASGVTEELAYDTARSLWSNYEGYEPCELVPYNFSNVLTYVISMKYKGQFKGVSLVAINNVNINGMGKTMEEALSNYRASRSRAGGDRLVAGGAGAQKAVIEGAISRVGMPLLKGQEWIFTFFLKGAKKKFQVVDSYSTPKAVGMQVGDQVICAYLDTREHTVTCDTFDIPALELSEENPAQTRYFASQEEVRAEVDRIDDARKKTTLLGSDRLKEVDPAALEKFLDQQEGQ